MTNNHHSLQIPEKRLKISVDYREKPSGLPDLLVDAGFEVALVKLPYCDYIINHGISVERKTGRDFAVSIIDGRLFKQARWMRKRTNRHGFRSKRMISKRLYLLQGLPNIGPVMALRLIKHFKTVHCVMNASIDELTEVDGIGEDTAYKIQDILR